VESHENKTTLFTSFKKQPKEALLQLYKNVAFMKCLKRIAGLATK
jgi:hypothetical protein